MVETRTREEVDDDEEQLTLPSYQGMVQTYRIFQRMIQTYRIF
jgi:hypothetical protein